MQNTTSRENPLDLSYLQQIRTLIDTLAGTQAGALSAGAEAIADALKNSRFLYAFGTGHSHMMALELFYRAGGLARVCPILDTALMLHDGAVKSSFVERVEGYAAEVLARYPLQKGDVLLIASNSGRNAVPVEMAREAKARGATVIALTSLAHAASAPSRHSSGTHLHENADIVIDNGGIAGDACLEVEGVGRTSPTSTVVGCTALHLMVHNAILRLAEQGCPPEIFQSANSDGGRQNDDYIRKYSPFIKHL